MQKKVMIPQGMAKRLSRCLKLTKPMQAIKKSPKTLASQTGLLEGVPDVDPMQFHTGGVSAFTQNGQAYLIISMRKHEEDGPDPRYVLIVRLKPNFLEVEEDAARRVVLFERMEYNRRESFWLFKRSSTYYMTYDSPSGWEGSKCYYRTATDLSGPWSKEKEIKVLPPVRGLQNGKPRNDLRSCASQHCYIMQINGQWVYGGDRFPHHDEGSHMMRHGYHIMCPVKWESLSGGEPDQPVIIWKEEWDIANYDGSGPDALTFRNDAY